MLSNLLPRQQNDATLCKANETMCLRPDENVINRRKSLINRYWGAVKSLLETVPTFDADAA